MKKIVFILWLIFISLFVNAQLSKYSETPLLFNDISIGASFGAVLFWGDGSDNVDLSFGKYFEKAERELSYDFFYESRLRPWVGVQTMFLKGNANGIREFWNNGNPANFRFETTFFQFNMQANVYPLQLTTKYRYSRVKPFASGGLGVVGFKSAKYHLITDELLNYYGYIDATIDKGNHVADFVIPFGFGADIDFDQNWALRIQNSFVYVTSDKFDGHIGRGTDINDMYTYTTVGVKYTFSKKKQTEPPMYDLNLVGPGTKQQDLQNPTYDTQRERIEIIIKTDVNINLNNLNEPEVTIETKTSQQEGVTIKLEENVKTEFNKNPETDTKDQEIKNNDNKTEENKTPDNKTSDQQTKLIAPDEVKVVQGELPEPDMTRELKENVDFRVQVFASSISTKTTQSVANLFGITEYVISREIHDGLYKFMIGNYAKHSDAKVVREKLRANRVPDAFIVYYVNGKRVITLEEIYK